MTFRLLISASAFALAGAGFIALPSQALAANATAAQSTTKACSTQYQAAKAAGTLNGKKWPQFLSSCSAALNGGAGASSAGAATAVPPKGATKQAAALAPAASAHQTTQQICSTQYQAAKTAGTLGGQKWPQFLSACSASIKNDKEDATIVPPEPASAAVTPASKKSAPSAMSSNGKPLSPGEMAFRQRIHECGAEWQSEKAAGTLPSGSKWPQFWSACNARLKAQG
jgi:hypothetical protein